MDDLLFGVLVTVVFLALIGVAGFVLYRVRNAGYARTWQPLVPVITGRFRGDGGGGAASWLDGTYGGRAVHARSAPGAGDRGRVGSTTTGFAYQAFDITVAGVAGRADWSLRGPTGGSASWTVITDDPGLRERLLGGGLITLAERLGYPSFAITGAGLPVLAYRAGDRMLVFREDAGPVPVPSPERFTLELDVLLEVVALTERVNPV